MFRGLVSILSVISFVMLEPALLMSQAYAMGKCQQHKQKIKQGCPDNGSMIAGVVGQLSGVAGDSGARRDMQQGQRMGNEGVANLTQAKAQCSQASSQCQADCQAEAMQKMAKKDIAGAKKAQMQGQQCKQEEQKQNAKNDSGLADLAKLLSAIAGLLAAMQGNDESASEVPEGPKDEDSEEKCDPSNPETAILVECQGESAGLASRASLNGLTGVTTAAGADGQALSRPLTDDPNVTAAGTNDRQASNQQFGQAGGAFATNGFGRSAAAIPVKDSEKGSEKDVHNGYMNAGLAGSGAAFSGGGQAKTAKFQPFSFDDPLGERSDKDKKKLVKLAGKLRKGSRMPAGMPGFSETNGPHKDNFAIIKQAYKAATPSLEH